MSAKNSKGGHIFPSKLEQKRKKNSSTGLNPISEEVDTAVRIPVAACWLVCHFDPDSEHMLQVAAEIQRRSVLESGRNKRSTRS